MENSSVAVTTIQVDETQTALTSAWSRGAGFYFQCAVVVIGVVGAGANALILYAMVASDQHKKHLLIFNQNVFDLCSCLLLVITYALKLCNIYLEGTSGYWLCVILFSENLIWCSINGSVINLLSVTVERYLMVVHPALSKKLLSKRVRCLVAAFAWVAGIVYNMALSFSTSGVKDGVCYGFVIWSSRVAAAIHGVWNFISFFVIVIFVFVFCYGRILLVLRRQASVMAAHSSHGSSSTTQTNATKIQTNVIKTMILVSLLYVITWLPDYIYYLQLNVNLTMTLSGSVYYVIVFVAFFYICINPFIYATKFDPVRRKLLRLAVCNGASVEPVQSASSSRKQQINMTQA